MAGDTPNRANNAELIKNYVRENGQELHPDIGQLNAQHFNRFCRRLENTGVKVQEDGSLFIGEYRMAGRYEDLNGSAAVEYLRKDVAEVVTGWIESQQKEARDVGLKVGPSSIGGRVIPKSALVAAKNEFTELCGEHGLDPSSHIIDTETPRSIPKSEVGRGDAVEEFLREGFGGSKSGGKSTITR